MKKLMKERNHWRRVKESLERREREPMQIEAKRPDYRVSWNITLS